MRKREYESYLKSFSKMWKERGMKGWSKIKCPACSIGKTIDVENQCDFCPINWDYLPKKERIWGCDSSKSRLQKYYNNYSIDKVSNNIALDIAKNPRWYTYEEWKDRVKITLKRDF